MASTTIESLPSAFREGLKEAARRNHRICFVWQDGDAFEVELNNHYD